MTSDISDVDLIESYQEATKEDVRQLARVYTRDAIQTLVALMKAPKTPPGVKRQCASDILSQGWGRPDSREDASGREKGGLTINILKLSTGVVDTYTHHDEEREEIREAVDVAAFIESHTGKYHE